MKWPTLEQFLRASGPFRWRSIPWTSHSRFCMNPYTMGFCAFYSVHNWNFLNMLSGGMAGPHLKFQPPDNLREAFLEAYNLIDEREGRYLCFDDNPKSGIGEWTEYNLRDMRRTWIKDAGMDEWERFFKQKTEAMEAIHKTLTESGVSETVVRTITLEGIEAEPPATQAVIHRLLDDKARTGLAL